MRKKISIKSAVLGAMESLGQEGKTNLIPLFKTWAVNGEKLITGFGMQTTALKKNYVLAVENCETELSCEVASIRVIIEGDHGCDCDDLMDRCVSTFYTEAFLHSAVTGDPVYYVLDSVTGVSKGISYSVQNNKIVFSSGVYNGKNITVGALSIPVDREGFPLVNETHLEALQTYIEWRWMKRSSHKAVGKNYSRLDISDTWREFIRFKDYAGGEDTRPEPYQERQMALMMNDPYSGLRGRETEPYYYFFL